MRKREAAGLLFPQSERPAYGLCYECGKPIYKGRCCKGCYERRVASIAKAREVWKKKREALNGHNL